MRQFTRIVKVESKLPIVKSETQAFLIDYLYYGIKEKAHLERAQKFDNKIVISERVWFGKGFLNQIIYGEIEIYWLNETEIELTYQYETRWNREIVFLGSLSLAIAIFILWITKVLLISIIFSLFFFCYFMIAILTFKSIANYYHLGVMKKLFPKVIEVEH